MFSFVAVIESFKNQALEETAGSVKVKVKLRFLAPSAGSAEIAKR